MDGQPAGGSPPVKSNSSKYHNKTNDLGGSKGIYGVQQHNKYVPKQTPVGVMNK